MGVVFRAERVDGELRQTVAIKVVRHHWFDPRVIDRFRNERQMFAGLVHGNIARLLDGGTRDDGVAWLAMEYVDGVPLDRYCEQRGLGIPDRIRLFLPLCEAVEYAHQKLIVHRDLKPSNVLVTPEGEPKLLDFGIAKALDAAPGGQTRPLSLTPEFASPEQARGDDATSLTDVYGLGGVVYFLLTGRPTHDVAGLSTSQLQRVICETPPDPPSQIRPELKGDLENILLKAFHSEPARRYPSVRQLREDLIRFLERRPVLATRDGWQYRVTRFLQRHAYASAASVLALLAAAVGTAATLYQAHRAQQGFAQVRTLANGSVFDFEAAIRDTPGTLAARRMVAATAREYLAGLAARAGNDQGLNRELAESYNRLSSVETSAGESDAGIAHLKRSLALLRQVHDDCCGTPAQRAHYVDGACQVGGTDDRGAEPVSRRPATSGHEDRDSGGPDDHGAESGLSRRGARPLPAGARFDGDADRQAESLEAPHRLASRRSAEGSAPAWRTGFHAHPGGDRMTSSGPSPPDTPSITAMLARVRQGQPEAIEELLPLVYGELRRRAQVAFRNELPGHTLQPTALVHEAFLRLFDGPQPAFADRAHFLAIAARVMRQVLVDHGRARRAQKRGPQFKVEFNEERAAAPAQPELLELDEALDKLGREDPRLVALIEMRFFAGMTAEETAEARSESVHVVRHDLRYAQARLRRIVSRSERPA
jgi:RNA polymerase sigma factor (TIGR02999 family)